MPHCGKDGRERDLIPAWEGVKCSVGPPLTLTIPGRGPGDGLVAAS